MHRALLIAAALALVAGCSQDKGDPGVPDAIVNPEGFIRVDLGGPTDDEQGETDAQGGGCADCSGLTPWCDLGTQTCVQCRDDADCMQGICLDNACRTDLLCKPNGTSCRGNLLRQCAGDGTTLISETDCGDQICFEGQCLNCRPGMADCATAHSARLCRVDGSDFDVTDCGTRVCVAGLCADCSPGIKHCEGTKVFQCQADGTTITQVDDCDTDNTGQQCYLGMCIKLCELNAKFHTNQGCEYWALDMDQFHDATDPSMDGENSQYAIVVSNTNDSYTAQVTIETVDGVKATKSAPPGVATTINLDPYNVVGGYKGKRSYRLTSTLPIVAYQFNPLENQGVYSNDASLLLPTNVLGKKYMVMSWPTLRGTNDAGQALASNFAVISGGVTDKVNVTVTVTAATLGSSTLPAMKKGDTKTFSLERFELLNFEAADGDADLTGSLVDADGAVAVFGGHVCADAPISTCVGGKCSYDKGVSCGSNDDCPPIQACDHMEEEIQPVTAWGKGYIVPKTFQRGKAPDLCRVLAIEDGTHVTVEGASVTVPVLNSSKFYEFEFSDNIYVSADKPILVTQFLEGQDAPKSDDNLMFPDSNDAGIGDPDMAMVVPSEQFRDKYVFLVPIKYQHNYISIVAPTGANVTLDGKNISPSVFHKVGSQAWGVTNQSMKEGSHVLAADQPVGVLVYGWDTYVSYSYPGGMNLETLQLQP